MKRKRWNGEKTKNQIILGGNDKNIMANLYRTHNCGELRINNRNEEVRLAGFVQTIRNLGKMMFIDLRDEHGITQIVFTEEANLEEKMQDINTEEFIPWL